MLLVEGGEMGSSDLGNVGHAYPTVNLRFKIAPEGTALHSDEFREAAGVRKRHGRPL